MNNNTKDALQDFISAVEELTAACVITIGIETAASVMDRCHKAKQSLEKDETIVEVR